MLPIPATLTSMDEEFPLCVGVYRRHSAMTQRSAVLLAKQIEHYVQRVRGGYAIFTREEQAEQAQRELALFADEQWRRQLQVKPPSLITYGSGWPLGLALGVLMIAIHCAQWRTPELARQWNDAWGRDSEQVLAHGEWWRLLTALGLHADPIHLGSNLFFGACFGVLVAMEYGAWLGWWWVILSGVMGNLAVCFLSAAEPYRGIGFSTAVFGAVGLLVAQGLVYAWRWRFWSSQKAWIIPLGGGVALLALFGGGSGDARIDVAAHLTGFISGIILGLMVLFARGTKIFSPTHRVKKSVTR